MAGNVLSYRRNRNSAPGDRDLSEPKVGESNPIEQWSGDPLDGPEARALHRQLLSWYYYERDRQAENRLEMAIDHDFYDGDQYDEETRNILESRRQLPVVYNEVAPMCDWMIGTERRNKVDWRVLPRTSDDVEMAEIKTQVLKYVSDINRVQHHRSRAFADAIKGGIGWVDDGVRDDPTRDPIYSRYEDWRHVLCDSSAGDLLGEEGRYVFRWRWVDEDVACMMFPKRANKLKQQSQDWANYVDDADEELDWQNATNGDNTVRSGKLSPFAAASTIADAQRVRVKLIECQYRKPMVVKFVGSGPLRGAMFDQRDTSLVQALATQGGSIVDRITMRVHTAVFTETDMMQMGAIVYRHNRFSLTPIICYRRGRDRMPYGMIRRVRTVQMDINKRASKANWLINTNQIVADENAFSDPEQAREEAQDPQGMLLHKVGSQVEIRRDAEAAKGQLDMMQIGVQAIQRNGVTNENLGRQTNATSEVAIRARQLQGSVTTTEPFDNHRLFVQACGEKQLSLVEQFYSEERVLRLTGARGPMEWVKINQPEVQPDGSVRWINDITAAMADFVVADADYAGTLRQVMFDSLMQLSQRLPPEIAVKLLRMAFDYSDLPNKDEITDELRKLTGETDPSKNLTPEEQQQAEQAAQMQAEAMQIQRDTAMAVLEEQRAKAREINARAEKIQAEIEALRNGDGGVDDTQMRIEMAVAKARDEVADEIDAVSNQLAKVSASNAAAVLKVRTDADTATEVERIRAASARDVAEIQASSDLSIEKLKIRIDDLGKMLQEVNAKATQGGAAEATPAAAPAPAPGKRALKVIRVDGKIVGAEVGNTVVTIKRDKDGNLEGGVVETKKEAP